VKSEQGVRIAARFRISISDLRRRDRPWANPTRSPFPSRRLVVGSLFARENS
jgi:hypothetical protein